MPKFNERQLMAIPEVKPPKNNVVDTLSRLKEENAGDITEKKIKISFEFFDSDNELFTLGNIDVEWFTDLLEELKSLSQLTRKQIFNEYKRKYKPHPYNESLKSLNYKDEYLINPQYQATQLTLTKSTGRIHGFFIGNIYYIRFLDRWHNMYNSEGYGGVKYFSKARTDFERLEEENNIQKQQIITLENKLEKNATILCDNCMECNKEVFKKFEL